MRELPLAHDVASPIKQADLVLCRAPVDASEPVYCLVSHGPVLSCRTSRHDACRNLYWRSGRDFLLGIRRGQPAGAQVQRWCSWHGCKDGRSRQTGSHGQLTHAVIVLFRDTGAKMPLPGLSGAAAERYGATPSSAGCPMPYRFNEPRRHKIPRARYRVQNWPEYDRALQRRGDLTVWVTPEAIAAWCPPRTGRRGRPRDYSDVAIETGHLVRLAFGRPWRQTEGLLRSLATLLGLDIGVPDHTTFSRRSPGLRLASSLAQAQRTGPVHVVIDSTGLKVYGAGEWLTGKHGERAQRTWRKLHLAVDPNGTVAKLGVRRPLPLAGVGRWPAGISARNRCRACRCRGRSGPGAADRPRAGASASAAPWPCGGSPGSWPCPRSAPCRPAARPGAVRHNRSDGRSGSVDSGPPRLALAAACERARSRRRARVRECD